MRYVSPLQNWIAWINFGLYRIHNQRLCERELANIAYTDNEAHVGVTGQLIISIFFCKIALNCYNTKVTGNISRCVPLPVHHDQAVVVQLQHGHPLTPPSKQYASRQSCVPGRLPAPAGTAPCPDDLTHIQFQPTVIMWSSVMQKLLKQYNDIQRCP